MKHLFLFPHSFKKPALVVLILTLLTVFFVDKDYKVNVKEYDTETGVTAFGYFVHIYDSEYGFFCINEYVESSESYRSENRYVDIRNTLEGSLLILSLLIFAFSKEKREDEYIQKIRLDSLLWATYVNYGLLFLAFWFVWGFDFFSVMVYNMFTHLIIFIVRFTYFKYKLKLSTKHEE